MALAETLGDGIMLVNLNLATSEGSETLWSAPCWIASKGIPAPHLIGWKEKPLFSLDGAKTLIDFLFSGIFAIRRRNPSLSQSLLPKWCSSNKKALVVHKKGRRKLNCINFKLY